ncbi:MULTISPECIES: PTS sugar transporter subunit IIA [Enterococcus]|uniref:PTS sugar transporter subunit IIA n=1 Tax=Candidatus Enterococcus murrayae TaxID=2815321 RepID=A0ABS3HEH5_9ENTE|nr:PTS sugar transporter subunit IIA [Enterococcus sp. MJM16]MBO0451851.1 PTS sugar transporter subunit IIA [Enterococcus sp. MJM16]
MLNQDFVYFDEEYKSARDLLSQIAKDLYKKGYVKETYEQSIISREEKYPTGLKLAGLNIAICHTEPKDAVKNTLFLVKPAQPVFFKNAETLEILPVDLVIGLVFSDGKIHLKNLSFLAQLFTNQQFIQEIKQAASKRELITTFSHFAQIGGEQWSD